jgi:uncharacterized protein YbjT (DUF2867 family)/nitrite reductase/ring-hydroxylating ferredoxin subunit
MKIVVIGGSGLIGSKVINRLTAAGHEAISASPNTGVNTLTGEGLADVLVGASVVIDVSNSPSFEDTAVMNFFQTSTRNLLAAEGVAGVKHHVALSVVGTDRFEESGYFRAKIAQEKLIRESPIPYSIVHATQFFEFVKSIADSGTEGGKVLAAPVLIQPIAADDVATFVARIATQAPVNGFIEIAGPEEFRVPELIRMRLDSLDDKREIVVDPQARYFGAELSERTLLPGDNPQIGELHFADWLRSPASQLAPKSSQTAVPSPTVQTLKENEFRISAVPAGSSLRLGDVAVYNVAGTFCATDEKCTHRQGHLSDGKLEGSTVTCPLHGSQFNVCTGEVLLGPAKEALKTYRVIVDGDIGRIEAASETAGKTATQNA